MSIQRHSTPAHQAGEKQSTNINDRGVRDQGYLLRFFSDRRLTALAPAQRHLRHEVLEKVKALIRDDCRDADPSTSPL
jgi:hypothetical protein